MTLLFVLGVLSGAHVLMILAIVAGFFIYKLIAKKRNSGSQKYKGGLNEKIGKR